MSGIDDLLADARRRRAEGAERFRESDGDLCMLCDAYGADKRSLFIDCFYAVDEAVPEALDIAEADIDGHKHGYYLRICKSCRGRLLGALRVWADECRSYRGLPKDHDGDFEIQDPDAVIPVRIDGTTRMLTREEYDAWRQTQ